MVLCGNKWDCGKAAWVTRRNVSCAVWEQVGLWEGCVGTSGSVGRLRGNKWDCGKAAWEQVGVWEGCVGIIGIVSSAV